MSPYSELGANEAHVSIDAIREFWNRRPCNIRHSKLEVGTREYFNEVERKKFVESHIPSFAQFPRWKGKKVLAIGCGIGTDTSWSALQQKLWPAGLPSAETSDWLRLRSCALVVYLCTPVDALYSAAILISIDTSDLTSALDDVGGQTVHSAASRGHLNPQLRRGPGHAGLSAGSGAMRGSAGLQTNTIECYGPLNLAERRTEILDRTSCS